MVQDRREQVLLECKANIRGKRLRAVGTLMVTPKRLSFRPLSREKKINIPWESIQQICVVGLVFKKLRIVTKQRIFTLYVKGAENVANLLHTLQLNMVS